MMRDLKVFSWKCRRSFEGTCFTACCDQQVLLARHSVRQVCLGVLIYEDEIQDGFLFSRRCGFSSSGYLDKYRTPRRLLISPESRLCPTLIPNFGPLNLASALVEKGALLTSMTSMDMHTKLELCSRTSLSLEMVW